MPKKKTQEDFVAELKVTHPNLNVLGNYVGDKKYVDVFCTIHNYKFRTKPNWLHRGSNCQKCYYERRGKMLRKDTDALKKELSEKHNNRFQYPLLNEEYCNNKSIITIVCKIHGVFHQTVNHHLRGESCPMCNESHLETFIESLLKNKNIKYIRQYRIFNILGYKSLDFYLPEYNIAIECQGIQHFKPIDYFGGTKAFNETINRDVEKYKSLNENKLNLIYIINKRNKKYLNDDIFRGIYDGNVFFKEDLEHSKLDLFTILPKNN